MFSSTKDNYQKDKPEPEVIDFDDNVMGMFARNINGKYTTVIRTQKSSRRKRKKFVEVEHATPFEATKAIHDFWQPEKPYRDGSLVYYFSR